MSNVEVAVAGGNKDETSSDTQQVGEFPPKPSQTTAKSAGDTIKIVSDVFPGSSLWPLEYATMCNQFEELDPPPSAPPDFDEIFEKTHALLDTCLVKLDERKQALTVLAFRVDNLNKDITAYKNYTESLNKFLVNYELTVPHYYKKICERLPRYGDFAVALEYFKEDNPGGLTRESFQEVSTSVRDNLYATAMNMKTQNAVVRDVNSRNPDRLEIVEIQSQKAAMFDVFNTELDSLILLAEKVLKYKSFLNFLRTSETSPPDKLDLTNFIKKDIDSSKDTSNVTSKKVPKSTKDVKKNPNTTKNKPDKKSIVDAPTNAKPVSTTDAEPAQTTDAEPLPTADSGPVPTAGTEPVPTPDAQPVRADSDDDDPFRRIRYVEEEED